MRVFSILRQAVPAILALALLFAVPVSAADISVIAANAVKDGYMERVAEFQNATGHTVKTTWTGTVSATKRVSDGEVFDVVIVGSANIDQLTAAGRLATGSRRDFAKTGVGIAIRSGLPAPDVATPAAVKAAVLEARAVVYSAGPSGAYVGQMLRTLGVADAIATRVKQPASGAEVAALLARGEADFGFAQVSEFMNVPGLVPLGPLPAEIQNFTVYAAGIHAAAPQAEAALALIRFLTAPEAAPAIRRMGMEPG